MSDLSNAADNSAGHAQNAIGDTIDNNAGPGGRADEARAEAQESVAGMIDEAKDVASDKVDDARMTITNAADQLAATAGGAGGKAVIIAGGVAAVAAGIAWVSYRVAKASVKRHPAVRVARVGIRAARDRRHSE